MRTPTKPKDIIAYGLSMGKLLETKGDWVHEDFMPVLERYTRAASANARTSNLLKRDLMNIHKTAKRNKELKSIGGSVAGKSGSMTAGHIRQSLKTRHEDEVQLAQKRLDRAKTSVVIRAEKRITKNRRWLKAYDKELWKDLSDQKAMWTDWFICVEQIETRFPFYDYDRYDEW
ncbi:MAG: hypothetical protein OHK93_003783 [Ramalina farinacea]|uniref:Uncharacterized protein n=1 Tax=Ramalina farinacea TaxID=258253 RepID=A0AA43TYK7_9LECA|nr:hypothetical protein [Ramalina farinacea]